MARAEQLQKANKKRKQDELEQKMHEEGMDSGVYRDGWEYKQLPPEKGLYHEPEEGDDTGGTMYNDDMDKRPDTLMVNKPKVDPLTNAKRKAQVDIAPQFGDVFWMRSVSPNVDFKHLNKLTKKKENV